MYYLGKAIVGWLAAKQRTFTDSSTKDNLALNISAPRRSAPSGCRSTQTFAKESNCRRECDQMAKLVF